jgi:hypothetical protein
VDGDDQASILSNRFSALEVEDYDTDGGTEPAPSSTKTLRQSAPKRIVEIQEDDFDEIDEKMFHIFCLFEHMQRIREFRQQTWKDYASDKIDLMAASITTNTALDLVREQCNEFTKHFPDLDGFGGATHTIWVMSCLTNGRDPNYKQRPDDAFDYECMDVAGWCLFSVYQLLDAFTRVLTPNFVPVYNGQYGWYKAGANRGRMDVRDRHVHPFESIQRSIADSSVRYNDDRVFLMQHLSEFAFLTKFRLPLPVMDELTRGLIEMCSTKHVPISTAFAAQVFLDTKNILRRDPTKAFSELRTCGTNTKQSITEHFNFHKEWPDQKELNWPKQNNNIMRNVQETVEAFVEKDWYS